METTSLTYHGQPLDTSPDCFGELRSSDDALSNTDELRRRFDEEGYLYLPGLLDKETLLAARTKMLESLAELDFIDLTNPLQDGVAKEEVKVSAQRMKDLSKGNEPLHDVLYGGPMIAFYERFLGGPVSPLDFTWCRVKSSAALSATAPHYDVVFMGRGTKKLHTSWTPLGDVPKEMGGLMILENSHRQEEIKATYGQLDVDVYCTNYPDVAEIESGRKNWQREGGGSYTKDAIGLQQELRSRWLTTDYQLGDLLIFSMYTMHASMDNQTNRLRLSTDTRYQLVSERIDERWIGKNPIGHGSEAKIGMIC
ncbi:MAG: phytanoyl-CoA dioxygenase family protein [Chloroflexota bacterium]